MTMSELMKRPTTIECHVDPGLYHESLCRSYHVLEKAKEWLRLGAPGEVVLEMIEHCMNDAGGF